MTLTSDPAVLASVEASPPPPATRRRGWRLAAGLTGGAVLLAAAVGALATATTGVAGDPHLANPHPHGAYSAGGVPRTHPPLWGVQNWPLVFSILFLVVAVAVMTPFVVMSVRRRRMNRALLVFLAVGLLWWLDPPANWVTFTIYDPRFLHFPTTWPWFRLSPSIEALMVVPGYPFYYFSMGLLAWGVYRGLVLPRRSLRGITERHPVLSLFVTACAVGFVWDIPTELFMMRADMYFYAQHAGPVIRWGYVEHPLIWSFYTFFSIAGVALLLQHRDDGRTVLGAITRRLPVLARGSALAAFAAALAFLSVDQLVPMTFYGTLRVTHVSNTVYSTAWPYPELRTYDPYGAQKAAGHPGPYYR